MIALRDILLRYADGEFGLHIEQLMLAENHRPCWVGPRGSGRVTCEVPGRLANA